MSNSLLKSRFFFFLSTYIQLLGILWQTNLFYKTINYRLYFCFIIASLHETVTEPSPLVTIQRTLRNLDRRILYERRQRELINQGLSDVKQTVENVVMNQKDMNETLKLEGRLRMDIAKQLSTERNCCLPIQGTIENITKHQGGIEQSLRTVNISVARNMPNEERRFVKLRSDLKIIKIRQRNLITSLKEEVRLRKATAKKINDERVHRRILEQHVGNIARQYRTLAGIVVKDEIQLRNLTTLVQGLANNMTVRYRSSHNWVLQPNKNDKTFTRSNNVTVKVTTLPTPQPVLQTHQSALASYCNFSKGIGVCGGKYTKWFYDQSTGLCKMFLYSGCAGNKNRFSTKKACEATCSRKGKRFSN